MYVGVSNFLWLGSWCVMSFDLSIIVLWIIEAVHDKLMSLCWDTLDLHAEQSGGDGYNSVKSSCHKTTYGWLHHSEVDLVESWVTSLVFSLAHQNMFLASGNKLEVKSSHSTTGQSLYHQTQEPETGSSNVYLNPSEFKWTLSVIGSISSNAQKPASTSLCTLTAHEEVPAMCSLYVFEQVGDFHH